MISRWRSKTPHIGEYMPADGNIIANDSKKTFKLNPPRPVYKLFLSLKWGEGKRVKVDKYGKSTEWEA